MGIAFIRAEKTTGYLYPLGTQGKGMINITPTPNAPRGNDGNFISILGAGPFRQLRNHLLTRILFRKQLVATNAQMAACGIWILKQDGIG